VERKSVPSIALKVDADKGIVEHIFAVMGNVDLGHDRIWNGAFTKTIAERGLKVLVLDAHKTDGLGRIVGKPLAMREIGRAELPSEVAAMYPEATGAVWARTQFLMETDEGKGAFIRIKEGAVHEWSFGYDALDYDYEEIELAAKDEESDDEKVTVRNLRTLKLYEYSPVLWGMNEATTTLDAKAMNLSRRVSDIEDAFYEAASWDKYWVREVWDTHLVVGTWDAEYPYYTVPFEDIGEEIRISAEVDWVGGNYVFSAGAKQVAALSEMSGRAFSGANAQRMLGAMSELLDRLAPFGVDRSEKDTDVTDAPAQQAAEDEGSKQIPEDGAGSPQAPTLDAEKLLALIEISEQELELVEV